jgi:hypothetical protein
MIKLPNRIFFTGVPGSRWSGIAQDLEILPGINTSDHNNSREYNSDSYARHQGAYFGLGMEFPAILDVSIIDSPWSTSGGCRIIKSHDWAYNLQAIKDTFPNDWIMLVYRPDMSSYTWWHEAGGFDITYPDYSAYKDSPTMLKEIAKQNQGILQFGYVHDVSWSHYSSKWLSETFDYPNAKIRKQKSDILVALVK